MNFHVGSRKRGDMRTLTITAIGTDAETINFIDCLSDAPGLAQVLAGRIVETVGMVNVRSDMDMDIARQLRRMADLLENREH